MILSSSWRNIRFPMLRLSLTLSFSSFFKCGSSYNFWQWEHEIWEYQITWSSQPNILFIIGRICMHCFLMTNTTLYYSIMNLHSRPSRECNYVNIDIYNGLGRHFLWWCRCHPAPTHICHSGMEYTLVLVVSLLSLRCSFSFTTLLLPTGTPPPHPPINWE